MSPQRAPAGWGRRSPAGWGRRSPARRGEHRQDIGRTSQGSHEGPAPGQAVTAHNEVVLDAASLVEHLPASVEAFFFGTHSSPTDIQFVRAVHQKFLEEHGMKDGEPGVPPLLLLDLAPGAGDEPFSSPGPAWLGDED